MTKCTLCGCEFNEETAHSACQGCGFVKGCDLVKCPRCGFENAPEPKWLSKLFRVIPTRFKRESMDPRLKHSGMTQVSLDTFNIRLDELNLNEQARVSFVKMGDRIALQKIIAIGALPNTEIILLQKFPSFVFQIGYSQFSVDKELASCIYVRPYSNDKSVNSNGSGVAAIE